MNRALESALKHLYPLHEVESNLERYTRVRKVLTECGVGDSEQCSYYSSPGRTEIGGNHTDHNGGLVLAAAVSNDMAAAVSLCTEPTVTLISEGRPEVVVVGIGESRPVSGERGSVALMRGILSGFARRGISIKGALIAISSAVPPGSGFSSSAALEMLVTTALDELSTGGTTPLMERAKIGQEAEHLFWGKPVGLLDQLACGTGGIIELDFADRVSPKVSPIEFDFGATGYELVTVDPGGDHSDLTEEYAAVPKEMFAVAHALGAERLKDISEVSLLSGIAKLRKVVGDRAIARALHFFGENRRVSQQVQALKQGNLARFVSLVRESGSSSWRLLQNCFVPGSSTHQPIMLALSLAERLLGSSDEGAARVHGGGFAGMILVVLQRHRVAAFRDAMEGAFGKGASRQLAVRKLGTVNLARIG